MRALPLAAFLGLADGLHDSWDELGEPMWESVLAAEPERVSHLSDYEWLSREGFLS